MRNSIRKHEDWFVYLLLCDGETFYVGITDDIRSRFIDHLEGRSKYTKQFHHFKLKYCERYATKMEAAKREKQIKGWTRAKKQKLGDGELGRNACTGYAGDLVGDLMRTK